MEELIPLSQVATLLDTFAADGTRVLGAEGFHIRNQLQTPDMASILDLSDVHDAKQSVAKARQFFDAVSNEELAWVLVTDRDD